MLSNPRFLYTLSAIMIAVGFIALFDGYAEFASGEEGLFRWLVLPASQFIVGSVLFINTRKKTKAKEAGNA